MISTILNYDNLSPWLEILLLIYGLVSLFIYSRLWYYRWKGRQARQRLEALEALGRLGTLGSSWKLSRKGKT